MATHRGWAASASSSARSASSNPAAEFGWRPMAAYTCGKASAAARAARQDSPVVPTVTIRLTPASNAASTSSASGGSHISRCVWLSITARSALGEQRLEHLDHAPRGLPPDGELEPRVLEAERAEQPLDGRRHVGVEQ